MLNVKMLIQYDGTRYEGWQVQKTTEDTIQGKLENVLTRLFGYDVEVIGSGRTDAGVHARAQVANFHIKERRDLAELCKEVNHFLPEDIAVLEMHYVEERFHARYYAISKTYRYRIHYSPASAVFERKYVYTYLDRPLDVERMRRAAVFLLGEHDFKSFCSNKHMKKSTVRRIDAIEIQDNGRELTIDYTGNGFLQNMVRILTGTLMEIGWGDKEPEDIRRILDAGNRAEAGFTAPACGLTLMEVRY